MPRERTKCDRCGQPTRNRKDKETGERLCNECRKAPATAFDPAQVQPHPTADEAPAGAITSHDVSGQLTIDYEPDSAQDLLMADDGGIRASSGWDQPVERHEVAYRITEEPTPLDLDLPPAPPPARENEIHRELIGAVEHAIENHPRSQQVLIGPSEIGDPCARCLGKKLLGIPQTRGDAWLPQIGTAVHAWLDDVMTACDCGWRTERRVTVGIIGNRIIKGSCDLFGKHTVVDYKIVGANTLKSVKSGPNDSYRVQCHLYGRGYELEGEDVREVAILYLPRNSPTLADSIFWTEPYSRDIALAALDRAGRIYEMVSADRDAVLDLPRAAQCYSCYRFAPLPGEDNGMANLPKQGSPFEGIL